MAIKNAAPRAGATYNPTGQAVDVITTVNGGIEITESIYRAGGLVGLESKNTRPNVDLPIDFVDWPFSKSGTQSFEDHLEVVKAEKPMYAVAPDIEDDVGLYDALEYADQLDEYASIVIVVPKDVTPDVVGDEYRIGVPCQNLFGGPPHTIWEYRNCEQVHLLGGSPVLHKEFQHYVNVRSVDTASIVKAAYRGSAWGGRKWEDVDKGFYASLECSIESLVRQWNSETTTFAKLRSENIERREGGVEELGHDIPLSEVPDRWLRVKYRGELEAIEDRIDPDETPFPPSNTLGPGDYVPFPGRAAFYNIM